INLGLQTRCYFEDEEEANNQDPVLQRIEHQLRRKTLIAKKTGDGCYRFDIRLQGEGETVFFDV
ncbi:MAG: protocatechuate 3,4-dioxygenase subunit alpha, partial [Pseudomonadota bacterium]